MCLCKRAGVFVFVIVSLVSHTKVDGVPCTLELRLRNADEAYARYLTRLAATSCRPEPEPTSPHSRALVSTAKCSSSTSAPECFLALCTQERLPKRRRSPSPADGSSEGAAAEAERGRRLRPAPTEFAEAGGDMRVCALFVAPHAGVCTTHGTT